MRMTRGRIVPDSTTLMPSVRLGLSMSTGKLTGITMDPTTRLRSIVPREAVYGPEIGCVEGLLGRRRDVRNFLESKWLRNDLRVVRSIAHRHH